MPSFQNYANAAGEFELRAVPQGSYDLIATVPDNAGRPYPGRVRIEVGNQDLEGVTLSIPPGVQVKVRVFVDGKFVPAPPTPPMPQGVVSVSSQLAPQPPPPHLHHRPRLRAQRRLQRDQPYECNCDPGYCIPHFSTRPRLASPVTLLAYISSRAFPRVCMRSQSLGCPQTPMLPISVKAVRASTTPGSRLEIAPKRSLMFS